jgi:hypothetical protein
MEEVENMTHGTVLSEKKMLGDFDLDGNELKLFVYVCVSAK